MAVAGDDRPYREEACAARIGGRTIDREEALISEVAVESVRREHDGVRALVRQLRAVEHDLANGGHRGVEPVLDGLIEQMRRHLYREMRHEEARIYPLLAPILGTEVPVLALVAEHRAARELVEGLHDLVRHPPRQWKWEDRLPAMRSKLTRLTRLLELHLRREEAAFSALLAGLKTSPALVPSPARTSRPGAA